MQKLDMRRTRGKKTKLELSKFVKKICQKQRPERRREVKFFMADERDVSVRALLTTATFHGYVLFSRKLADFFVSFMQARKGRKWEKRAAGGLCIRLNTGRPKKLSTAMSCREATPWWWPVRRWTNNGDIAPHDLDVTKVPVSNKRPLYTRVTSRLAASHWKLCSWLLRFSSLGAALWTAVDGWKVDLYSPTACEMKLKQRKLSGNCSDWM